MLRRLLVFAGFRVGEFATGGDFLCSLNALQPVCAIVDLEMPGLSGFEVLAHIRSEKLEVPVVFMTASDEAALDRAALAAGGKCLLRKPFASDELLTAITFATGMVAPKAPP